MPEDPQTPKSPYWDPSEVHTTFNTPAVSRITRTPITIQDLPGLMGQFSPADNSFAGKVAQFFTNPINKVLGKPSYGQDEIQVARKHLDVADPTINHEQIHAALNPIAGQLPQLNQNNPAYANIRGKWPIGSIGDPNLELPAYAQETDNSRPDVPQEWLEQYKQNLLKQLVKLDPKIADQYRRLARVK